MNDVFFGSSRRSKVVTVERGTAADVFPVVVGKKM